MQPSLVRDLMATHVATLGRNDVLSVADRVMSLGRVRHLPVVDDDGTLCGVVTHRDLIFNALARALGYGSNARSKTLDSLLVKDVMTTDVVTIRSDAPLTDAAQLMRDRLIGCLPVVDDGRLVGLITEASFVDAFLGGARRDRGERRA